MAETNLGGHVVNLYMHQQGYDKLTSACPCAPYLMKVVQEPDSAKPTRNAAKSVMVIHKEIETVKFKVVYDGCNYLHMCESIGC